MPKKREKRSKRRKHKRKYPAQPQQPVTVEPPQDNFIMRAWRLIFPVRHEEQPSPAALTKLNELPPDILLKISNFLTIDEAVRLFSSCSHTHESYTIFSTPVYLREKRLPALQEQIRALNDFIEATPTVATLEHQQLHLQHPLPNRHWLPFLPQFGWDNRLFAGASILGAIFLATVGFQTPLQMLGQQQETKTILIYHLQKLYQECLSSLDCNIATHNLSQEDTDGLERFFKGNLPTPTNGHADTNNFVEQWTRLTGYLNQLDASAPIKEIVYTVGTIVLMLAAYSITARRSTPSQRGNFSIEQTLSGTQAALNIPDTVVPIDSKESVANVLVALEKELAQTQALIEKLEAPTAIPETQNATQATSTSAASPVPIPTMGPLPAPG